MPTLNENIKPAMQALGLSTANDEFIEHFMILVEAQHVYQRRFSRYRDMPIKAMGWKGCLFQARTCIERGYALMLHDEWKLNEALDTINYCVHYARQGLKNNGGTWLGPLDPGTPDRTGEDDLDKDRGAE